MMKKILLVGNNLYSDIRLKAWKAVAGTAVDVVGYSDCSDNTGEIRKQYDSVDEVEGDYDICEINSPIDSRWNILESAAKKSKAVIVAPPVIAPEGAAVPANAYLSLWPLFWKKYILFKQDVYDGLIGIPASARVLWYFSRKEAVRRAVDLEKLIDALISQLLMIDSVLSPVISISVQAVRLSEHKGLYPHIVSVGMLKKGTAFQSVVSCGGPKTVSFTASLEVTGTEGVLCDKTLDCVFQPPNFVADTPDDLRQGTVELEGWPLDAGDSAGHFAEVRAYLRGDYPRFDRIPLFSRSSMLYKTAVESLKTNRLLETGE